LRLSVDTVNEEHRERIIAFIKNIFPFITISPPDEVIEKNKPGIIVLDKETIKNYASRIQEVYERDGRLNFSVILSGKGDSLPYLEFSIDPESLTDDVAEKIRKVITGKMNELTNERLKERVKGILSVYDKLGYAVIITDKKGKIVYFNEFLVALLKKLNPAGENFDDAGIINIPVVDFFRKFLGNADHVEEFLGSGSGDLNLSFEGSNGIDVTVYGFPIRVNERGLDGYIFLLREISYDITSKELWKIFEKLINELNYEDREFEDKYFLNSLLRILGKFASHLGIKTIVFVPIFLKYLKYEETDETPALMVQREDDGTKLSLKYGPKLSEEDKNKCFNPEADISYLLNFDREPNKNLPPVNTKKYIEKLMFNGQLLGILCLDREVDFIREERILITWLKNEISSRIVRIILGYETKSIDLLEKTIGTSPDVGIVVLDNDGHIIRFNKGFFRIFGIPEKDLDKYRNASLENLPGLKNQRNILQRIKSHFDTNSPKQFEKWIEIDKVSRMFKYLHIYLYPLQEKFSGSRLLVCIFEEKSEERLNESRRRFVHDIIVQKMKIYEEISQNIKPSEIDFQIFISRAAQAVCDKLSEVLDGVIFSLGSPPDFDVLKCSQQIRDVLSEEQVIKLLNYLIDKRNRQKISGYICNIDLEREDLIYGRELRNAGYRYMLVVPIKSPAEQVILGHIVLFVKFDPNNVDQAMIFSKIPSVCKVDQIHKEEVDIFAQFANVIGDYLSIVQKDIESRRNQEYIRQIFENVEDAILVVNRDGIVERSNRVVENVFGISNLVGSRFVDIFNTNVRNLIETSLRDTIVRGENLLEITYELPSSSSIFVYRDERLRHIRLKFQRVTLLGHTKIMIVARDITDLTKSLDLLQNMTSGLLGTLLNLLGGKSATLKIHSANVAYLAGRLAVKAYPEKFTRVKGRGCLVLGAILHDIGKIRVPSSILVKPMDRLVEDLVDYETYKRHVLYGKEMMENIPLPCGNKIPQWIFQHHEAMDGSGYPLGLKGDQISYGARVIAAANHFENEIIIKPFKKQKPAEEVIRAMRESGKFDPPVVDALEELLSEGVISEGGPGQSGKLVSTEEKADSLIKEIIEDFKKLYEGKNLEKH